MSSLTVFACVAAFHVVPFVLSPMIQEHFFSTLYSTLLFHMIDPGMLFTQANTCRQQS